MPPSPNDQNHPTAVKASSPPQPDTNLPSPHPQPNQNELSTTQYSIIICFCNGCPRHSDLAATRELAVSQARRLKTTFPPNSREDPEVLPLIAYLEDPRVDMHSPVCPQVNRLADIVLGLWMRAAAERRVLSRSREEVDMGEKMELDDLVGD